MYITVQYIYLPLLFCNGSDYTVTYIRVIMMQLQYIVLVNDPRSCCTCTY